MIQIECIGDGRKACDKCEYVDVLLTKAKLPCKDKEKCIIVKNSVWKLDRKQKTEHRNKFNGEFRTQDTEYAGELERA